MVLEVKKLRATFALALVLTLIAVTVPIFGVKAPTETLIWEAIVWSGPTPTPVASPVLEYGREYRIVAKGSFISCDPNWGYAVFAADPQYYTMEFFGLWSVPNWWFWTSPVLASPSILQIDGKNVYWGPFDNGGATWSEGHEYTISYIGVGAPITFTIADWIDGDYTFNFSHFNIQIYEGPLEAFGETAFAYGGAYATCFRCMDFDGDGKGDFKNWGWSNGPLAVDPVYTFDIYAGAAKCDINKGTLVGTLTVDYDGSTATVTYMMNEGWTMGFAQLYVGSEPLPRNSLDEYTTSPGQFPLIEYVEGPTHTFTVPGLSGDIYVVAHADVFEV